MRAAKSWRSNVGSFTPHDSSSLSSIYLFIMLKSIFYSRFHPDRGPSVIHQYPENSIRAPPGEESLLCWSDISSYIIPPYDLCNQPVSICANGYRVLGYPISLEHEQYHRNRFTFNVCFVLSDQEDAHPWQQMLRKIVRFFVQLEWDACKLQTEEDLPGLKWAGEVGYPGPAGAVYMVLERIGQDLNQYGETCIRVDDVHVLNLRLELPKEFAKKAPAKVRAWHVPLLVRSIPTQGEWTWDLTLQRIHAHIDGIRHVRKIADLADVELKLVKRGVRELVYHGRAIVLDIFHFQAIYTCTDELVCFARDPDLQDECRHYIHDEGGEDVPTREHVLDLYTSLRPGIQLQEFCLTHRSQLSPIDVRRFITFGIIKGFIRRVHKYALAKPHRPASPSSARLARSKPRSGGVDDDAVREFERAWTKAALSSGWATPPSGPHPASFGKSYKSADRVRTEEDERLRGYLDGKHALDQICVDLRMSEKKVLERLRSGRLGEVILWNR
jgi:hypothetical protein